MPDPVRPIHGDNTNYGIVLDRMYDILNHSIDNGGVDSSGNEQSGNVDNRHIRVVTPGAPNTEFSVVHNLGRIPKAFNVVYKNASCDVYDSGTVWTNTTIFLKCTVATVTIKLEIY